MKNPWLVWSGAILGNLSMLATSVVAYLPPIDFEAPDFVELDLVDSDFGYTGWDLLAGNAEVSSSGEGLGGGQALRLSETCATGETRLRRDLEWNPAEEVAFIDLWIKPPANPEGSSSALYLNGSQVAFQLNGQATAGEVWVYSGDDDAIDPEEEPIWYPLAPTFALDAVEERAASFLRLTLRHDVTRRVWDVFVDGKMAAANLGFEGRVGSLHSLDLFGSDVTDVLIDELSADPDNMLFPDADQDGLPDAWETANGSDPNRYDRDEINPATGKSWLEDYLDSLWSPSGEKGVIPRLTPPPVGVVPPLTILGHHVPIGALKGALTVGGDGSAAYSIPIDLPKGTAGMEPKLSLDYSSNGGNGIAGLGWSLSGLQQITRGGTTLAKDGFIDGVDFDANDRFFFNGERLVLMSGTYGADGSEYRTEMDSFARIIAHGQTRNGPAWWTVETKSGLKLSLGNTADACVEMPDDPSESGDQGGVLSWSVNRVEDTVGNYFEVHYTRDAPTTGFPDEILNQRVDRIDYTGNDQRSLDPYCAIEFAFESRPDARSFYTAGVRQVFDKRLSAVVVSTDGYENHRYELEYLQSEQTGRSLLQMVTKVAAGQAIPPTVFQWQTTGHEDPKWLEVGELDIQEYGSGLDSSGDHPGYLGIDETGSEFHLTGATWRTLPIDYTITSDTVLDFEYRADPLPSYAMIGLDVDLSTSGASQLVKLVGGGSPPAPVAGSDLYAPAVAGDWQRKQVPAGTLFSHGQVSHLVLVSHDVTPADGEGESWFRNVRIYENGTDPATVAPLVFDPAVTVPRLTEADKDEIGWTFADLNGDGWSDLLRREFYSLGGGIWGGPAPIGTYGQNMLGSPNGFDQLGPLPEDTVLMTGIEEGNNKAFQARRLGLMSTYTDIDADGRAEACVVADAWRVNMWNYRNEHAFIGLDADNQWIEHADCRLPFYSQCNINYNKFDDFSFRDLDGDGYPDLSVDTGNGGKLYDTDTGQQVGSPNGTYAWPNRLKDGGGWVAAPGLAAPMSFNTGGLRDRRYMDVDADGLVDFVRANSYYGMALWLNTGAGWEQMPGTSPLQMPVGITNGNGDDIGTRMLDLNGDGMVDIIKDLSYGGVSYPTAVFLGTGTGWQELNTGGGLNWHLDTNFTTFDKYDDTHQNPGSLVDINVDGLVDFVHAKYNRNFTYINTGTGWWKTDDGSFWADGASVDASDYELPVEMYASAWGQYAGKATARFADLNGDGAIDYIAEIHTATPRVFLNLRGPEVIASITDGFEKTLDIEYARLNDPSPLLDSDLPVYTPHDSASDPPLTAGHVALQGGGLVVSRLFEPDGLGGTKCTRRHYGDLRYDRENQVSLGFGWVEVHEASCTRNGNHLARGYTRTEMKREHPYSGSPERVETYVSIDSDELDSNLFPGVSGGMKLVGVEESAYAELATGPASIETGDIEIRRPIQTSSIVSKYDIDDGQTLLSRVTTIQDGFNEYGFVTASTVTALDGSITETDSTYSHQTSGGKWLLGRLSQTTVVKSHPTKSSITKTSTFGYDSGTGLLSSETVEPTHSLTVTTEYDHDEFGNVTRTEVTASGETRWSESRYDARGRFVTEEENALGTVYHHYDQQLALQTGTTDVNGRTTTFVHDGFGTQVATYHPNRTKSAEITFYAGNADLPSQIESVLDSHFITLKWARCAEASGAPCSTVYFDQVGREVLTETTVLTSAAPTYEKQYTLKLYDERGRLVQESTPFLLGDAIHYTTHTYDFLDRRIRTTRPDGAESGIVEVSRESLTGFGPCVKTVTDNPLGHQLSRWTDQHERTVQTADASGQTTVFGHDVEGRLEWVTIDGLFQLFNIFDLLGNKIGVWDLSGGYSSSTYNGFGEVISTTNARLQTTITEYDGLGRVTEVIKPEGTFLTTYETSGENLGAVKQIDGPAGYLETFTYGENDNDYGLVTSSSTRQATGRPTYTSSTEYNCLGQPVRATDAGGAVVETTYDTTHPAFALESRLIATSDIPLLPGDGTLISRAPTLTVNGNDIVSIEVLPNSISRTTTTDARNGFLTSIMTEGKDGDLDDLVLQNLGFTWDLNGNLLTRTDGISGEIENFGYDNLDRLISSQVTGESMVSYSYDSKGNLTSKSGESRSYANGDYRVTGATVKGAARSYSYDDAGFVTSDGQRTYEWTSFGQLKSVTQTSAPAAETFLATGQLAPTVPGIPQETRFHSSNVTATFEFDAGGNRARQVLDRLYNTNDHATVITRYLGSYELEEHVTFQPDGGYGENKIIHRHRLGGASYLKETGASGTKLYLSVTLTDHIGSTDAVLRAEWDSSNQQWKLSSGEPRAERQSFGALGERREQSDWTDSRTTAAVPYQTTAVSENHGFTGHEMLDDFGLIHMNGRIYDPELGRMLSPDPYVQVPEFSQNFNRYSYVVNNPLKLTDPSGFSIVGEYFHAKAFLGAREATRDYLATHPNVAMVVTIIVAVVVTIFTAGSGTLGVTGWLTGTQGAASASWGAATASAGFVGATSGSFGAAAAGGDAGDILRGAAVGVVQGSITAGVLHGFGPSGTGGFDQVKAVPGQAALHIAGHGIVGGLASEALGGKFQDGFLSAAAGAAASWSGLYAIGGTGNGPENIVARTAVAGIVGGTASTLGGGKFANGAHTAAFQHLLNAEGAAQRLKRLLLVSRSKGAPIPERAVEYYQDSGKSGPFDTTTVYVGDDKEFADALISQGKYDQLVYLGHGVPGALAVSENAGGNIISDGKGSWIRTKVSDLATFNFRRASAVYPPICLIACDSATTRSGYGSSVAQAFADHFRAPVLGAGAGVGFQSNGAPGIRGWRIAIGWLGNAGAANSGGGGWSIVNHR